MERRDELSRNTMQSVQLIRRATTDSSDAVVHKGFEYLIFNELADFEDNINKFNCRDIGSLFTAINEHSAAIQWSKSGGKDDQSVFQEIK